MVLHVQCFKGKLETELGEMKGSSTRSSSVPSLTSFGLLFFYLNNLFSFCCLPLYIHDPALVPLANRTVSGHVTPFQHCCIKLSGYSVDRFLHILSHADSGLMARSRNLYFTNPPDDSALVMLCFAKQSSEASVWSC